MSTSYPTHHRAATQVLAGGLVLGSLDLVYACSFWAWLRHVPPQRLLQFIASGALGDAAFQGGTATALAGTAFHYLIATTMVLAYYLISGRHRWLLQHPVRYGLPYGLLLWAVMTHVVVPLSLAEPSTKPVMLAVVTNFLMHLLFGVICAWFARRAHGLAR
ncbi:hypothetical protein [Lysobacter solisilvae (ex Woo and Kim 2020)]|uniref:DUF1440 domain-containing protein n=1 Tax=Agrilutibacter terrestris TaxID=2865112 RepID=A0A7H0FV07_9GAMM|nr:hypothetical protein [Lysobacter terrestris]QNP39873.1 hypothetical protein H8B22_10180 [Lysobacter terrestris]